LLQDNPQPSVEINSIDAAARDIHTGNRVEVRTLRGKVRFRAQVTDHIVQGAIEANMGGGGPNGPKAWQESNVNRLTDLSNYDEISGFPVYKCLLCDVVRVADANNKVPEDCIANYTDSVCSYKMNVGLRFANPTYMYNRSIFSF
jgi:anaerobic selenocysteine-containing dehydrogenase